MGGKVCRECGRPTPPHYTRPIHLKKCSKYKRPVYFGQSGLSVCACGKKFITSKKHPSCWTCRGLTAISCKRCHCYFNRVRSDSNPRLCVICLKELDLDEEGYEKREAKFTIEQVERIVAKQMECLPDWWKSKVGLDNQ